MTVDGPEAPRKTFRPVRVAVATLIGAWVVFLFLYRPRGPANLDPPRLSPPFPVAKADVRWTLRNLDGSPKAFSDYQGHAVFLNIWATWCPPCRDELPAIANLASNPRLKGVSFLCASVDEDLDTLRDFVKAKKLTVPVARATTLPEVFQSDGIPATFLIAPDGTIVASQIGAAQWDDPAVVDFLEQLAKRSP